MKKKNTRLTINQQIIYNLRILQDYITKKHIDTHNIIHSEKDIFKFLGISYILPYKR